ncbi:hypothetical protein PLESTB_000274900 [Pleodorina starrii]|uniref:Condensin complex subunit 2 n=1 Tax=Pleodorina starrii TaxID=330485 RepID=A0A9W6EYM3_9CHLO|nr:hypothetical protein PLESTB_000274900 [Pleodorina starrii]
MDIDAETEVDQGRRQRAAQKLADRFAPPPQEQEATMNVSKARDMLKHLAEMSCGNKISVDNAFDLQGIDALKTIVFSEIAKASALCGEGHFQSAGAGLDISIKIYGKRVDATYNLAYSLGSFKQDARKDDDADGDDQDEEGRSGGTQADGAGEEGAPRALKGKKRQGAANAEATLVDDSELRQRVKEPTFDMDPFFVRTSRLIDDNSPQGLLLHNLPVLCGTDVVFDAGVKPQELLEKARQSGSAAAAGPGPAGDVMVDLTALAGALECLAAAASAPISPGIEQLYELLQPRPDLPGLQVASKVDPEKLLSDALAANDRARAEAHRNKTVRQAVRQIEDAMDVDMDEAGEAGGGGGQDGFNEGTAGGGGDDDDAPGAGSQFDHLGGDDVGAGYGGDGDGLRDGYDSPGYGAGGGGGGNDDDYGDAVPGSLGGTGLGSNLHEGGMGHQERSTRTHGGEEEEGEREAGGPGKDLAGSDDESALLSLLGAAAAGSAAMLQRKWWKSHARKKTTVADAAEKAARARKPKPEYEPLDWRSAPEPQLESAKLHTYKTARKDASAKLCMPLEEPARPEALHTYFSAAPAVGDLGFPVGGAGAGVLGGLGGGGGACSVQETWRALLMADCQRERQLRRGGGARAAAAAARKSLGNGAAAGTPGGGQRFDGPSASGTDGGPYGGEEYGNAGQDAYSGGDGGGFGDAGPQDDDDDGGGGHGGYDDDVDDDADVGGGGGGGGHGKDGWGPTLEELLQPPRRVRRLAVKYDKTAGVADVATLKANIEVSLKELAASATSQRRQSAPLAQPAPALSFQRVLDQVSAHAAAGHVAATQPAPGGRPGAAAQPTTTASTTTTTNGGGGGGLSFLTGVTPHLAFICLLHLANEKRLALRNSEQLDTLMITELGDLVGAVAAAR